MSRKKGKRKENEEKPHYGYYALTIFLGLAAIILVAGAAGYVFVSRVIGIIIAGFGLYLLATYIISLYWLKQSESFDFTNVLQFRGDEQVLDVGCGLGKVTVGAAKQLTEGTVTGIDVWNTVEIPGNSPEIAYKNAEIEGVRDRVEFKSGDVLNLEFEDNTFDVVTSSSVLNNLPGDEKKSKALREIYRVLKPGGIFFLLEPLRDVRGFIIFSPLAFWQLQTKEKWIALLKKTEFVNLQYQYKGAGHFIVEKL
ncbi:MAG: class I SAM-dependent methyltransferase [Theionarchaea archaeon]|nr:class I SAM-dependent methyltransferase [Theionarchaea archaeon]